LSTPFGVLGILGVMKGGDEALWSSSITINWKTGPVTKQSGISVNRIWARACGLQPGMKPRRAKKDRETVRKKKKKPAQGQHCAKGVGECCSKTRHKQTITEKKNLHRRLGKTKKGSSRIGKNKIVDQMG